MTVTTMVTVVVFRLTTLVLSPSDFETSDRLLALTESLVVRLWVTLVIRGRTLPRMMVMLKFTTRFTLRDPMTFRVAITLNSLVVALLMTTLKPFSSVLVN